MLHYLRVDDIKLHIASKSSKRVGVKASIGSIVSFLVVNQRGLIQRDFILSMSTSISLRRVKHPHSVSAVSPNMTFCRPKESVKIE